MLPLNCLVVDSESMPKPKPWPLEKPIANSVPTETVNFSPLKLSHLTINCPAHMEDCILKLKKQCRALLAQVVEKHRVSPSNSKNSK